MSAKSLGCVNGTRSNKEIMITIGDIIFRLRILKGNLIAISLIGTDESLQKIEFFGKSKFGKIGSFIAINIREKVGTVRPLKKIQ